MSDIDYAKNVKYFKSKSYKGGIVLIAIGVLIILSGQPGPILVGMIIGATGGVLIYSQISGRPSDEEIDRQVFTVMSSLHQKALNKLGLDAEEVRLIEPILVGGYFPGSLGGPTQIKRGKDGELRSSVCEGVVIFFAEQELHSYKYQVSLTARGQENECTDVYFYRDVVSVSTSSMSTAVVAVGETKQQTWMKEIFRLTTSGGTAVECSMGSTDEDAGRQIQGARQLIRNKKMHTP